MASRSDVGLELFVQEEAIDLGHVLEIWQAANQALCTVTIHVVED